LVKGGARKKRTKIRPTRVAQGGKKEASFIRTPPRRGVSRLGKGVGRGTAVGWEN